MRQERILGISAKKLFNKNVAQNNPTSFFGITYNNSKTRHVSTPGHYKSVTVTFVVPFTRLIFIENSQSG